MFFSRLHPLQSRPSLNQQFSLPRRHDASHFVSHQAISDAVSYQFSILQPTGMNSLAPPDPRVGTGVYLLHFLEILSWQTIRLRPAFCHSMTPLHEAIQRSNPKRASIVHRQRVDTVAGQNWRAVARVRCELHPIEPCQPHERANPQIPIRRLRQRLDIVLGQAVFGGPASDMPARRGSLRTGQPLGGCRQKSGQEKRRDCQNFHGFIDTLNQAARFRDDRTSPLLQRLSRF